MVLCCLVGDFLFVLDMCGHLGFPVKMGFSGLLRTETGMDIN